MCCNKISSETKQGETYVNKTVVITLRCSFIHLIVCTGGVEYDDDDGNSSEAIHVPYNVFPTPSRVALVGYFIRFITIIPFDLVDVDETKDVK